MDEPTGAMRTNDRLGAAANTKSAIACPWVNGSNPDPAALCLVDLVPKSFSK
jgi:hypothetical protein